MLRGMKFIALRQEMLAQDMQVKDIAQKLGRSLKYVYDRFNGEYGWDIEDCYVVLEMLGLPQENIGKYFPRGGV